MSYNSSVNIERDFGTVPEYIVTANAKQAVGKIVSQYQTGVHSFCLIGSYGTGKSSFLLALENSLLGKVKGEKALLKNRSVFKGMNSFLILNIVGDYQALKKILANHLDCEDDQIFDGFEKLYQKARGSKEFLIIVIDEFGKVLEHAAKNNPEQEMYFLQQFCEWVNSPKRNILFLSTLHQGFGAYAKNLKPEQRQEWQKVKGRISDIVFMEPIEQLLNLAAVKIGAKEVDDNAEAIEFVCTLAKEAKIWNDDFHVDLATALYPLDVVAAYALVLANQRYGQNERTLFSFLESQEKGSLKMFKPQRNHLFNLAELYDYIVFTFYSRLLEVNEDSGKWSAIKIAIERVEGANWSKDEIDAGIAMVKAIGILNIFAPQSAYIDKNFLVSYASLAMGMKEPSVIIDLLEKAKIIRYAQYKKRYILYEGTDVDIEGSLYEAARERNRADVTATALSPYVDFNVQLANAHYFRTGTARYFQFLVTDDPIENIPKGEVDGYINIVLPDKNKELAFPVNDKAILYCAVKDDKTLGDHLHEIDKLNWVRDFKVNDVNDKVALREIENLLDYEKESLGKLLFQDIYSAQVDWWYRGEKLEINSEKELIHKLSKICESVYHATPIYHFELINKSKPTGNMALARYSFLMALLDKSNEAQLGFEKDKFPPEKSLYLTLLEHTGVLQDGVMKAPTEPSFEPLWKTCEEFLASTCNKPRKVSDLHSILYKEPFRLKKGFIECWVPTYLILKRDDYSLYSEDRYVPYINRETIELLLRSPQDFQVKAFKVEGVKKQFFDKYREAINLSSTKLGNGSFIETIRPFLTFYRRLNNYAKRTKDLSPKAIKFRNVISTAVDPEKVFFETLPEELGFKEIVLTQNPEAIESFVEVLHDAMRELRRSYDDLINLSSG